MEISPVYDRAVITVEGAADAGALLARQRRRLLDELAGLTDEQWAAPTRCEGWSVRDVVLHVAIAEGFWHLSIAQGLQGEPTRFLAGFDPKASPADMVAAATDVTAAKALARLQRSTDDLLSLCAGLDAAGWETPAEAPPGHLPIRLLALHALWDGWIHERDVLLPLGLPVAEELDEALACLRYCSALGVALPLSLGEPRTGSLGIETAEGSTIVLEVGDVVAVSDGPIPAGTPVVRGSAVELVEAFSQRGPFPGDLDLEPADRWLVSGLGDIFETT